MEKNLECPTQQKSRKRVKTIQLTLLLFAVLSYSLTYLLWTNSRTETLPINAEAIVAQCRALHLTPGPPDDFQSRTQSDRFEEGTRPTLIRNATIWTGLDEGNEVIQGDILIDKGLVKKVGSVDESILRSYADVAVLDAAGSWVSPGYADTAPNHSTTYSSKHLVLSTCIPTLEWAVHRH
jgi:hypothetical protein